jgi:heme/copper-type cytochrome/quinol oxidase subunit 3
MSIWWRDVIREATFEEQHKIEVRRGLRFGMILFIISEVMFFFAFFWAFFHSSLSPVFNIGGICPPKSIIPVTLSGIPLTNTFLLLSSGAAYFIANFCTFYGVSRLYYPPRLLMTLVWFLRTYIYLFRFVLIFKLMNMGYYLELTSIIFLVAEGIYLSIDGFSCVYSWVEVWMTVTNPADLNPPDFTIYPDHNADDLISDKPILTKAGAENKSGQFGIKNVLLGAAVFTGLLVCTAMVVFFKPS